MDTVRLLTCKQNYLPGKELPGINVSPIDIGDVTSQY